MSYPDYHEVVDLNEAAMNSTQKVRHDKFVLHRSVGRSFVDDLAMRNIYLNHSLSRLKRGTTRKCVLDASCYFYVDRVANGRGRICSPGQAVFLTVTTFIIPLPHASLVSSDC